jgi:hypothetical protein
MISTAMIITAIELPMGEIAEFCDRWQVIEVALIEVALSVTPKLLKSSYHSVCCSS